MITIITTVALSSLSQKFCSKPNKPWTWSPWWPLLDVLFNVIRSVALHMCSVYMQLFGITGLLLLPGYNLVYTVHLQKKNICGSTAFYRHFCMEYAWSVAGISMRKHLLLGILGDGGDKVVHLLWHQLNAFLEEADLKDWKKRKIRISKSLSICQRNTSSPPQPTARTHTHTPLSPSSSSSSSSHDLQGY